MRLLVIGAGSTGGYFGGRLAEAGGDVSFLVRPARAAQLAQQGLRIASPHGDAVVQPKVLTADQVSSTYEAVLLAVKGFHLAEAVAQMAPAIGPETMILPVLNGMRHMNVLAARFAPENLVGCALKVATILEDDGRIVQLTPLQDLAYGELDGRQSSRIAMLDRFMQGATIGARLSSVIHREMWEKWILLASLGAITCLMRGTIGEIEACAGGSTFAGALLDEVAMIVEAIGEPPSEPFLHSAREQLTMRGSPLTSSMFRDLQRGRPVEVEDIVGDMVRRAGQAGLAAPLLSAAYVHLRLYQNRIAAAQ